MSKVAWLRCYAGKGWLHATYGQHCHLLTQGSCKYSAYILRGQRFCQMKIGAKTGKNPKSNPRFWTQVQSKFSFQIQSKIQYVERISSPNPIHNQIQMCPSIRLRTVFHYNMINSRNADLSRTSFPCNMFPINQTRQGLRVVFCTISLPI